MKIFLGEIQPKKNYEKMYCKKKYPFTTFVVNIILDLTLSTSEQSDSETLHHESRLKILEYIT